MKRIEPVDQEVRERAKRVRDRNLIVDAGAGTGKTQLIVDRVLHLVAPEDPAVSPLDIHRIAVITFTRRAAGELRFRIRAALLDALAKVAEDGPRRSLLRRALNKLDTAFLGTIDSFADRLLRIRPIEAQISPQYAIVEDITELAEETYRLLVQGVEAGTLAKDVSAGDALVAEAVETIQDYRAAGLRSVTRHAEFSSKDGLDAFVRRVIEHRDVIPSVDAPPLPDLDRIKDGVRNHIKEVDALTGDGWGHQWLRRRRDELAVALDHDVPMEVLRAIQGSLGHKPTPKLRKKVDFQNDNAAWTIWKNFWGDASGELEAGVGILVQPLHDWMASRLIRTIPVILGLYEKVKARHEVVDFLDLLLKLRRVLHQPDLHAYYRGLFDHILVDEFQDTDPLQAEVLFYLTSDNPPAENWAEMSPRPGSLTIVGDPKQSIYRFRRADIAIYDGLCRHMEGAQRETLEANFRSTPALIEFFNAQLSALMGRDSERRFDPDTGKTFYEDLSSSFEGGPKVAVHRLQYSTAPPRKKDRAAEAQALARHLRWMKEREVLEVRDLLDHELRDLNYGDVAVLARSTGQLTELFRAFEQYGIPYTARGGTLFLQEPVIRQFILGLRAIADSHDGVAQAALYRPPFFAVDLADVVTGDFSEAEELVATLRRERFSRPPAATAFSLLNGTTFGRMTALTPNGQQQLKAVRNLISRMDVLAQQEGLDFDAVTERLRDWVERPGRMDAPAPLDRSAVQVLTIHQAKGLEFPVVAIWDGYEAIENTKRTEPWLVSRDGREWSMSLDNFRSSSPGTNLAPREVTWQNEERLRLYYVAATRARDLLVIPEPHPGGHALAPDKSMCARILDGAEASEVETHEPELREGIGSVVEFPEPVVDEDYDRSHSKQMLEWQRKRDEASRPHMVPMAITTFARAPQVPLDEDAGPEGAGISTSRFGAAFGSTVHRALAQALAGSSLSIEELVRMAAVVENLTEHIDEAVGDVRRAISTLKNEGIIAEGIALATEYPLLLPESEETLLVGSADLVARGLDVAWVIDFKTDAPGTLEEYPAYQEQVRLYAHALVEAGTAPLEQIRAGLLFTADGGIRWVELETTLRGQ